MAGGGFSRVALWESLTLGYMHCTAYGVLKRVGKRSQKKTMLNEAFARWTGPSKSPSPSPKRRGRPDGGGTRQGPRGWGKLEAQ